MDNLQPLDFVYCGNGVDRNGKRFVEIRPIAADKTLMPSRHFDYKRSYDRIIGQMYRGASFNDTHVSGLNVVKWVGRYDGPDADTLIIEWSARNEAALQELASLRLEKDTAKRNEIEKALLPIRRAYQAANDRGDLTTCVALERAVAQALRRRVAADEKLHRY